MMRTVRGAALVAWLSVAVAVAAATALADTPAQAPRGALIPLTGTGSCLGASLPGTTTTTGTVTTTCPPIRGIAHDRNPDGMTFSAGVGPTTLYVSGGDPWAIAVLHRNPATGALTQLPGPRGCVVVRRMDGCALLHVRGHVNDMGISRDGRHITISVLGRDSDNHNVSYTRNPHTGAVRRRDGHPSKCRPDLANHRCGSPLRGLRSQGESWRIDRDTGIITGSSGPNGAGIAVLHRNPRTGRWGQPAGATGCATTHGTHGCAPLRCPPFAALAVTASHSGRDVYVAGGDDNSDGTYGGYVATFRTTAGGGLTPIACVASSPGLTSPAVPVWIAKLPHSSTVLIDEDYANQDVPTFWDRIFAATPGANGALHSPHQISGNLGEIEGELILAHNDRTLYAANNGGGSLYVFSVSPTAVTALPAPWSVPYRSIGPHNDPWYGLNSVSQSPNGRFMYVAAESTEQGRYDSVAPSIVAYRVQP